MVEREMIIKALECCAHIAHMCRDCPMTEYRRRYNAGEGCDCHSKLSYKALTLLKAQEPVKPKIVDTSNSKLYHNDMFKNHYCGNCGEFLHVVNRKDLFCSQCGRAVKWE